MVAAKDFQFLKGPVTFQKVIDLIKKFGGGGGTNISPTNIVWSQTIKTLPYQVLSPADQGKTLRFQINEQTWVTGINYSIGDYVTNSGELYVCLVDNTSSINFQDDLDDNFWSLEVTKIIRIDCTSFNNNTFTAGVETEFLNESSGWLLELYQLPGFPSDGEVSGSGPYGGRFLINQGRSAIAKLYDASSGLRGGYVKLDTPNTMLIKAVANNKRYLIADAQTASDVSFLLAISLISLEALTQPGTYIIRDGETVVEMSGGAFTGANIDGPVNITRITTNLTIEFADLLDAPNIQITVSKTLP